MSRSEGVKQVVKKLIKRLRGNVHKAALPPLDYGDQFSPHKI